MKTKSLFDLDPERLATTNEKGERVYLYPEDVTGKWKARRQYVYWSLIALYLVLPWFNVKGRPALQMDFAHREFTFLGGTLHGIEPVLFFLLVAGGLFFIAFLTSLFGRVWCGWACPQTVFIQTIFWKLERWIEGTPKRRRDLDGAAWGWEKIVRRSVKWLAFVIVSLHIAHTFIGYFVGPRELVRITTQAPHEHWGLFVATMVLSLIFLLDFGWFREQFCIIACPYGRMQSVMMDENSLVIAYDGKRGEPRRGLVDKENVGDCINCYHCVKVCPTGIDIRRGTQLECIHCTQCIDACDEIMERMKLPTGLIRYASENEMKGGVRRVLTARSGLYLLVACGLLVAFGFFLKASTNVSMVFLRSKTPFHVISAGRIVVNTFTLKLSHQGERSYNVSFRLKDPTLREKITLITPSHPTVLDRPELKIMFLFRFPGEVLERGDRKVVVEVVDSVTTDVLSQKEVSLVGPTTAAH